jgi:hypothetical protein
MLFITVFSWFQIAFVLRVLYVRTDLRYRQMEKNKLLLNEVIYKSREVTTDHA